MDRDSFRWFSSTDCDVDAYALSDETWLLFAIMKSEAPRLGERDERLRLAASFKDGPVSWICGAMKTPHASRPLVPIVVQAGASPDVPHDVWAREDGLLYRLELSDVLNPGLFLDQRNNRQRLKSRIETSVSRGRNGTFLNLFSYTGSFSVAARKAGAVETVSVDVSKRYLGWEKANFEANFGQRSMPRLICDDARVFLERSSKRKTLFRWIVIDPPTFSRGSGPRGKGVFHVEKELFTMVEMSVRCLEPGGAILVSTNDAKWPQSAFFIDARRLGERLGLRLETEPLPDGFGPDYPLKTVWFVDE